MYNKVISILLLLNYDFDTVNIVIKSLTFFFDANKKI
jgi:hypothetical protein